MTGFKTILLACSCILMGRSCLPQRAQSLPELVGNAEKESAAKNWQAAIPLWLAVNDQNPVNQNYTYQLGNAYYQSGNFSKAIEYFEKGFHLTNDKSYYCALNVAKAYAAKGDKTNSFRWIKKSFDLGIPNRSELRHPVFDVLKDMPEYRQIAGIENVSSLNRIEGWRYDLKFLEDEIMRMAYHVERPVSKEAIRQEIKRIDANIARLNDMQLTVELMKLCASLGDGHTVMYAMGDNPNIRKYIPLEFYWFKEGFIVIEADKRFESLLGAQLISIEGRSPEKMVEALKPIISKDNDQAYKVMGLMRIRQASILHTMGLAASPDQLSLKLRDKSGREQTLIIRADCEIPSRRLWDGLPGNWVSLDNNLQQKPFYLEDKYDAYWFKYLKSDKTVWFQYNQVMSDPKREWNSFLDSLFSFIESIEVNKLIIDLRNNNGGNGELSYALVHQIIKSKKINQWGKLFIITGRKTFSAAGICIALLERHTRAIFAGEPAGTSPNFTGEEFEFVLPFSKLAGNISDRDHHAYSVDYRSWIAPSIYVEPTFEDFKKGRDAVWESIKSSFPPK